jgi:hypothetical protein
MSSQDLQAKKKLLSEAFRQYCSNTQDCGEPPIEKPSITDTSVANLARDTVSCRQGYSLLSCGMENNALEGTGSLARMPTS